MNDAINPYDPPKSNLDGAQASQTPTTVGPFFQTSIQKLVLYSFATVSLYFIYWHYKQWKLFKDTTGANIYPFWRTVFSPFFVFDLFNVIRRHSGVPGPATSLAAFYCIPVVSSNILSRINDNAWLLGFIAVYPLTTIQQEINEYMQRAHPGSDKNERITGGGVATLVIGGILWLLIIAGMVLPDTPA